MHKKRPRCCRLVLEAGQVVVTYTFSRGVSTRRLVEGMDERRHADCQVKCNGQWPLD